MTVMITIAIGRKDRGNIPFAGGVKFVALQERFLSNKTYFSNN